MDKTARTEFYRLFLIERLPEPLTPMSSHIQIFDNYIENTRIRLRNIRVPETKDWRHILQQRFPVGETDAGCWKAAEIFLNDLEYQAFERFEGREIRKNRYFHEFDSRTFDFDIYLGPLWGLCTAKIDFQTAAEMEKFEPPTFAVFEVTGDPFFFGENLVNKRFEDVRAEVEKVGLKDPNIRSAED
jgi:CYTH domain-containing protein